MFHIWSILENVLCALEENVFSAIWGYHFLKSDPWFSVVRVFYLLVDFLPSVLSIIKHEVIKSIVVFVELSISPFNSQFLLLYCFKEAVIEDLSV